MGALQQEDRVRGVYRGKVLNTAMMESTSGTPFIELRVRLTEWEDEETAKFQPTEPFTAACPRYLSEKALPVSLADLAWLGFRGKSFEELAAHDFAGQEIYLKLDYEEYKGKVKPRFNMQRRQKRLDDDKMKALCESLNDIFAAGMAEALGEGEPADSGTGFNFGANEGGWPEPSNN